MHSEKVITINLSQSEHATSFSDDGSFFRGELQKAERLMVNLAARVPTYPESRRNHTHDAITILGPRGAGKTSFILSLKERVESSHKEIQALDLVDPTLMEDSETFLITVTSMIIKGLSGARKTTEWTESYRSLCVKFRVLAPKEVQHALWKNAIQDPDSFAYEMLAEADSGRELANAFSDFVFHSARLLNKKAFMLAIDDVDTAFQKGWPVLETLRMYLANPFLITIISGNLELYEMLCRNQQWSKIKPVVDVEISLQDSDKISNYKDQVDQLTSQYLLKILPPYNRITLLPIANKVWQQAKYGNSIIHLADKGALEEIYTNFCAKFFGVHGQREALWSLDPGKCSQAKLFPSNSRRFLGFLRQIIEYDQSEERSFWLDMSEVFRDELYKFGISLENIEKLLEGDGFQWLTRYCILNSQNAEFWRLDSRYSEEANNHIALLLQGAVYISWKSAPPSILEFGLKTAYLGCALDYMRLGDTSETNDTIINYLHLNLDERTGDTCNRLVAFMLNTTNWQTTWHEFFQLTQKRNTVNIERAVAGFTPEIASQYGNKAWLDSLKVSFAEGKFKGKDPQRKDIVPSLENFDASADDNARLLLEWFSNRFASTKGAAKFYVSFIIGLGHLADFLRASDADTASEVLNQIIQRRTYPVYTDSKDIDLDETEITADVKPIKKEIQEHWVKLLLVWRENILTAPMLPPPVIARAMVRLKDNFISIKTEIPARNWSCGFILKQWTMAFINSLLVEEAIYKGNSKHLNLSSVGISERTLTDNLKTLLTDNDKAHYLAYHYLQCPLFQIQLGESPEIRRRLHSQLNPVAEVDTQWRVDQTTQLSASVYEQLCGLMATPPQARDSSVPKKVMAALARYVKDLMEEGGAGVTTDVEEQGESKDVKSLTGDKVEIEEEGEPRAAQKAVSADILPSGGEPEEA